MAKPRDFIPERFVVEWHPSAEIEAECVKLGMKTDDGTSYWDWVEIQDHAQTKAFRKFDDAVAFALTVAEGDCFHGARIYKQLQELVRDGKRTFIRWEDHCFWDGINGDDKPDAAKPDEWCA